MKIAIGSDHAGFKLKETVKEFLKTSGIEVIDFGTHSEESADYPDFAFPVAEAVAKKEFDFGILICGTGIGMSITANKVAGIRAALCNDLFTANCSKEHNDANVLCMGGRIVGEGLAKAIVQTWLERKFQGGRHERRVKKIEEYETKAHSN
ncbi:MAG: ribose 5-phosphate isomerase B [Caldiserica bacterium CG02_land_8_20_14_3_00_36_38]|jgi:ribose 5-phosphate isomerase B|nr:ribose 5-phosphate isomerase B [Caldisericota bacterium]OIP12603.1 MAG: ribose 5-phosphate isomerase B [Caldisericum sp. CG2_30_36_11]PIP50011.1 MAG: ribose 5-phosphate isomerase B [Caldiserica bacterium CG23_combo_of_CG06-09_8_20_14_all_35_60]PIV55889.1 MAG: ribose 5-phosphate isomerase B [Caldiserica bacterium CG02_land_8_20_14_3_00_36_38]PIX28363.1 MAG: ribose 5-phosphate isomerase B [Caldiserica bacterium CG_4_8_14_3_um_filter_35_18]